MSEKISNSILLKIFPVIISALLYSLGYLFNFLAFAIIISLFLIFYFSLRIKYNFFHGLSWGIIVFGVISYPVLSLFYQIGDEHYRFFSWLFLVIYSSLYSGLWFKISSYLSNYIKKNYFLLIWILSTFFFFWWLENGYFFIFGQFEGFSGLNPLVPLIGYSLTKWLVVLLGKDLTLLFLLMHIAFFVWVSDKCANFKLSCLAISILLFMFICICLNFFCNTNFIKHKLKHNFINYELDIIKSGSLSWDVKKEKKLWQTAYEVKDLINDLIEKNKNLKIIILPESTFPFFLNKYPEVVSFWFDNINIKDKEKINIIIGSHRCENGKVYNTCYWLSNGVIKEFYDKHHGLFFAERLPNWAKKLQIKNLILKNSNYIHQNRNNYKSFKINNFIFSPLICSEIFFENKNLNYKNITLALINDAWCKSNFFAEVLLFCAMLQACDACRDILYISHSKNIFIDSLCNLRNLRH